MNSVLVTGATGFIGSSLIQKLSASGVTLRAVTRNLTQPIVQQHPEIDWQEGDVTQSTTLIGLCQGIDVVYHLAGFAHADEANEDTHEAINFQGVLSLAREAKQAGVKRFIFFSTIKASDDDQSSAYGVAKRKAEKELLNLCQDHSMQVVILRPALVYGVGWKGNLAAMLKAVDRGLFPPPPSRVQNKKSLISVTDLCEAAFLAGTQPLSKNEVFTVTDGRVYSTHDIYRLMRAALQKSENYIELPWWFWKLCAYAGDIGQILLRRSLPISHAVLEKLFLDSYYDSSSIERELIFKPRYSLETELPAIVAALKGRA